MNNESRVIKAKPVIKIAKRIMPDSSSSAKPIPSPSRLGFYAPIAGMIGKRVVAQRKTGSRIHGVLEDINNVDGLLVFSDATVNGVNHTQYVGTLYAYYNKGQSDFVHFHLEPVEGANESA